MKQLGIGDYVSDGLTLFGKEVNTNRQITLVYDGLKPVYRRLIYTALQYGTKMTKTATIGGTTLGSLHPHGESIYGVVSTLVRYGIFDGQGNHGAKMIDGDDIAPSAPRYTEARISDKYLKIFSEFMPYVPYKEAEIEGFQEPEYLPTPVPLCLSFGNLGIGFGANMRIPAFTVKSMYDALMADDPTLLRSPFGLELVIDQSELSELWTKGLGRLTYKYKVEWRDLEAGSGALITGDAELFKPDLGKFDPWINRGSCFKLDLTTDIGRVFIGRNYNVKAISLDDIYNLAVDISTYQKMFRLTVSDGNQVYVIPLREWLNTTYENYLKIIERYKADKISKYNFDYLTYKYLPVVAEHLMNDRNATDEIIRDRINEPECDIEVVKAIMRKSISTLRNTDSTTKLESIQSRIDYFTNLDPAKHVKSIINEF